MAENSSLAETTRPSTDKIAEDNKAVKQILEELGDSGEYNSEAGGKMSRETDPEILKKLNSGKTMTVYRSMQMIDGKLSPPMAAKVKGKMVDAAELGTWYVSDERPDAINRVDDRGIGWFTLDKANGDSLEAAYNPYWHTSNQYIASDREDQLYDRKWQLPHSDGSMHWYESGSPAERLTEGVSAFAILEEDPKKNLDLLYDILADGVENGDLYDKDSLLNKLLWKLGF